MADKKQCPLCGKSINEEDAFCEECQNHMDNQYDTELLEKDSSEQENIPEIEEQNLKPETDVEDTTPPANTEQLKPRKGLSKGVIFVLVGCVVMVIVGVISSIKTVENRKSLANEEVYWNECVAENTPVAYAKYLVAFQNGRFVDEADKRIREFREAENQAWLNLKKSSDINDFYAYLGENPKTPYINQIKSLMDSLSWISTSKDNTADAYKAYLENVELGNLAGNYIGIAKEKYDYLSQIKLVEGASLDSLKKDVEKVFETMSENDMKLLLKTFASEVFFYNKDSIKSSTDVVAAIDKERKSKKIKNITYTPRKESVIATRDSRGVSFVDLIIDKNIVYDIMIKEGKKNVNKKETLVDTLKIELNKNKQIQAIGYKLKKATL